MTIKCICVGKIKEAYLRKGIAFYEKALNKKTNFEIIEVPDETTPDGASQKVEDKIRETEGERILRYIPEQAHVCALCIDGKQFSTKSLQNRLNQIEQSGCDTIVFVIGGSLGLSNAVVKRAKTKLSFSAMTFPHQMMRMILLAQLERVI